MTPELLRAFALGRLCRTGPTLAVPSEDCRARPGSIPLPRPASPETARHEIQIRNTLVRKAIPHLGGPVGIYKLLPSPALPVLTAARGQQETATYQTRIARFSFLLQVPFCKFMRSKLCRHTTWFTLLLFLLSFLITKSVFVPALSPAAPSRPLYHLPFMAQLPLLCSRTRLSLPRCFIIFLLFSSKQKYLRKYNVSSSVDCSDAVPGITAGSTTMGETARI